MVDISGIFMITNETKNKNKGYGVPSDISKYILSVEVDRRSGTNINQLSLLCDNIPYDGEQLLVRKSITNDENVVTDPMDRIKLFIDDKIQFTGYMMDYKIDTNNAQVTLTVQDSCILLKRGLNCYPRKYITYSNVYTSAVIAMLGGLVGVTINIDSAVASKSVLLESYKIENGQNIYDAIVDLCDSLDAVIYATKDGTIVVKPSYIEHTGNADFNYDDINHITSASTTISGSLLKPTIFVTNSSNPDNIKMWSFTDKEMLEYLNKYDDIEVVESTLAINQSVAKNIAHVRICKLWRDASIQDIMIADGNPDNDVDKTIQTTIDENSDIFRVIGMTTIIDSENGYIDKFTLECIHSHTVEFLGDFVDCDGIRNAIVNQAKKYLNVPFQWGAYYRTNQGEWGMVDEALITHTLIDLNMRTAGELTTSIPDICNNWCIPITKDKLKAGDIVTWQHDLPTHEMGWYIGNDQVLEVWGSIITNQTPTAMKMHGYYVKIISLPDFGEPECWRLKELSACE